MKPRNGCDCGNPVGCAKPCDCKNSCCCVWKGCCEPSIEDCCRNTLFSTNGSWSTFLVFPSKLFHFSCGSLYIFGTIGVDNTVFILWVGPIFLIFVFVKEDTREKKTFWSCPALYFFILPIADSRGCTSSIITTEYPYIVRVIKYRLFQAVRATHV